MDRSRQAPRNAASRRPSPAVWSTNTWFKLVLGFLALVYVLSQFQQLASVRHIFDDSERLHGFDSLDDPTYHPKISIIVVWTGKEQPNYLTWFLDSIARQPDEVELILIQRGNNQLSNLPANIPHGSRNVKLVQMSDERCECKR